jgi:hypothetical protein
VARFSKKINKISRKEMSSFKSITAEISQLAEITCYKVMI